MENIVSDFAPTPLERRDASGQIARQLREAISLGTWSPGERLPSEQELAAAFDVARSTAREGLKLLSATGMVTTSRGSNGGTFVSLPDADEVAIQLGDAIRLWFRAGNVTVQDVDEARAILELQCVDLAARRRTTEDLEAILRPVERSRDYSMDIADWLDLDLEFHTAICRAAKNKILELAMTAVHLSRPATNSVFVDQLDRSTVTEQHYALYQAIEAGDPDAAARAFTAHVDYLAHVRLTALNDRSPSSITVASLPDIRETR
ncbi:FadR/GntR family transcriptional regulator [Arthrobacter sp. L77]|uniref:FadR/GntR family transcriptional regulator n=1 Tax=Arthrobacter sp. L77 TaxID=1496689 RepID=UPI0018CCF486|nr:FadR/GntR family transcriptional regulator [Arthrobacter sp. L77]